MIFVETKKEFVLVLVTDFTHLPIGDYDAFIEKRLKTGNTLQGMASMVQFLQTDSQKVTMLLQDKILEITSELIDMSKTIGKSSVLSGS